MKKLENQIPMPKSFLCRNYRATTSPPLTKERKSKSDHKKRMHAGSTLVFPVVEMKIPIPDMIFTTTLTRSLMSELFHPSNTKS